MADPCFFTDMLILILIFSVAVLSVKYFSAASLETYSTGMANFSDLSFCQMQVCHQ